MRQLLLVLLLAPMAWAGTCGQTTVGGSSAAVNGLYVAGASCTPPALSVVNDLQLYEISGTGAIGVDVFKADGAGGAPSTLLCTYLGTASGTGWQIYPIVCPLISSQVWLGYIYSSGSMSLAYAPSVGTTYYYVRGYDGTFDAPFNPSFSTAAETFSEYLDLTNASASAVDLGYPQVGGSSVTSQNVQFAPIRLQPSANTTVTKCDIYLPVTAGNGVGCAIATDVAGKPDHILCSHNNATSTTGFNDVALSGCGTLAAGTTYWGVLNFEGATTKISYDVTGVPGWFVSQTYGTFVDFSSPTATGGNVSGSLFIEGETAPSARHQSVVATETPAGDLLAPLSPTPIMGWGAFANSAEATIRAASDAITSTGLSALGWLYISPDIGWVSGRDGGTHQLTVNGTLYPSGMPAIVNYVHGQVPRQKFVIYLNDGPGTGVCGVGATGSTGFETSDADQVAGYGVDWLRYDDCFYGQTFDIYNSNVAMAFAVAQAPIRMGMTFSQSAGAVLFGGVPYPAVFGAAVGQEVWTYNNYQDPASISWTLFRDDVDFQYGLEIYTRPGRYNTPDFLWFGRSDGHNLTDDEAQSQFSLWSIFGSNLWTTADPTAVGFTSSVTYTILSNTEVIAVDQDVNGYGGKRYTRTTCGDGYCECFARQLSGTNTWALVGFNRASTTQTVACNWSDVTGAPQTGDGMSGPYTTTRDLIGHTSLGTLSTGYSTSVVSHGVWMIKVSP